MIKKIKFSYREADNQNDAFTPYHTVFKCKIKVDGLQYSFKYQCNTAYSEPNLDDCLYAITSDAMCYENSRDVVDFCNEFGYEDIKGIKAYKACKKTYKALHRLFTDDELDEIMEYLTEKGF